MRNLPKSRRCHKEIRSSGNLLAFDLHIFVVSLCLAQFTDHQVDQKFSLRVGISPPFPLYVPPKCVAKSIKKIKHNTRMEIVYKFVMVFLASSRNSNSYVFVSKINEQRQDL